MFLDIDTKESSAICAVSDIGDNLTYGELCDIVQKIKLATKRSLAFIFCENSLGSLCGYMGFLSNHVVPLMIDKNLDPHMIKILVNTYRPAYYWLPDELAAAYDYPCKLSLYGYSLLETGLPQYSLYDELALLITTSGSTGSPKLVRQSYKNLIANARSIVEYLELDNSERAITTLPMTYVYGLSIINSHLLCGAEILFTTKSIMQKEFWKFFKERCATSFGGVPYTYEILKKLRFMNMDLPSLQTMTQAGGKLLPELHEDFAKYAQRTGKRFYVMYGASEATSRMGYLPFDKALEKYGSMGIAIPGGTLALADDDGRYIEGPNIVGELVYRGDNVTLGYAERGEDLSLGDQFGGVLFTGDMARRDEDGYFYIVGRKKRFLKIFGNRINLDEVERMLKSEFPDYEIACSGTDDLMTVFITDSSLEAAIIPFVSRKTGLNAAAFRLAKLEAIPKNEAGKTLYTELVQYL